MPPKSLSHAEYLAKFGEAQCSALQKLCTVIKSAAPKAEECISYQLAAFKLDGRMLVAVGATANHCAFYLMSASTVEAHAAELGKYDTSKGTIRFSPDQPLPATLVRKLVRARIQENSERLKK